MKPPTRQRYEEVVYKTIYPSPTDRNPASFHLFVRKYIVEEVRWENLRFYGREDERGPQPDALYPGHDYSKKATRIRLGSYPGHKKLFSAFDRLGMSSSAIHSICVWEGTRSAKERHEFENKTKIIDITLDGFTLPLPRKAPTVTHHRKSKNSAKKTLIHLKHSSTEWSKKDYYSNPTIWSNSGTLAEDRAQASENGFRDALELSATSQRSTSRHVHFDIPNPNPDHLDWSRWAYIAQQSGIILPTGSDHNQFLSHMPAHFAYATTAAAQHGQNHPLPPSAVHLSGLQSTYTSVPGALGTQDASTQVNYVSPYPNVSLATNDIDSTSEELLAMESADIEGPSYHTGATAETFMPHSPVSQRGTRTTAE